MNDDLVPETDASGVTRNMSVNEKTGGKKGAKLARFSLIPVQALWALAEHYGKGAESYADRNWERGYNWSLSYDALNRHLNTFWEGHEDYDPDNGSHHMIAVAWHAFALFIFGTVDKYSEFDDRPNSSYFEDGIDMPLPPPVTSDENPNPWPATKDLPDRDLLPPA